MSVGSTIVLTMRSGERREYPFPKRPHYTEQHVASRIVRIYADGREEVLKDVNRIERVPVNEVDEEVVRAVRQKLATAEASMKSTETQIEVTTQSLADHVHRARRQHAHIAELTAWLEEKDPEGKHGGRYEHPEMHGIDTLTNPSYYDHGGGAILRAAPGRFRVVGVDTFSSEDWVYEEYGDLDEAIQCADAHAEGKNMQKVYVYDDRGYIKHECGSM